MKKEYKNYKGPAVNGDVNEETPREREERVNGLKLQKGTEKRKKSKKERGNFVRPEQGQATIHGTRQAGQGKG